MALSQRFFNEALREMNRAFAMLDQPLAATAIHNQRPFFFGRRPPTDVHETKSGYELQAELPGFNKNDIEIEVPDSRTIVLRGTNASQRSVTNQAGGEQQSGTQEVVEAGEAKEPASWWANERVVGSFSRSFSFPVPINAEAIKATFKDGVLSINVPKLEKQTTKVNIE